jgi:MFS family permease
MSEFIPESRRTEGLAYWGLAGNMAIAAAPAVGLMVFFRYGWFALCVEMAVLSVVMLVWSSRLPGVEHRTDTVLPSWVEAWDWRVIRSTLSMAVIAFGYGGVTSYVAMMADERMILPRWLFFAVYAVTVVLVRVFTSRLGDVFGVGYLLYPSFAAFPVSLFLLAGASSRADLIVAAILFGIGFGGAWPAFANFIVTNTEARWRGRSFGSIVLAFDSGIGIGSLVIGSIIGKYSYALAFTVAGALSCLAIPIFVLASRGMTRKEA